MRGPGYVGGRWRPVRLTPTLRGAVESLVWDAMKSFGLTQAQAQEVIEEALFRNVIRNEIDEAVDFILMQRKEA